MREIGISYYTNWCKRPIKDFLKSWFFYWDIVNVMDMWLEFVIRFLGFTFSFKKFIKPED